MNAGQIIRLVRTIERLPQGELARRLSVTSSYLSQIENGKKQPSLSLLKQISEEFSFPLPLLVLGDKSDKTHKEIFAELQNILSKLLLARAEQVGKKDQLGLWDWNDKEKD
jgi:transcriptional regulator with XRE-family HTH domain